MDASFLSGANATFIAELYAQFLKNPAAVDASWAGFFGGLNDDEGALLRELAGASWAPSNAEIIGAPDPDAAPKGKPAKNGRDVAPPADKSAVLREAQDLQHPCITAQRNPSIASLELVERFSRDTRLLGDSHHGEVPS